MPLNKTQIGYQAQKIAFDHLSSLGIRCIYENYLTTVGEIDLITIDQEYLCFVEVRFKKQSSWGTAIESISPRKQRKIQKAAQQFLLEYPQYQSYFCRFDVIAIQGQEIVFLKNAFFLSENEDF